ncbi:hypothetical protein IMY05_010G0087600 [Salix suchowensis]|nr:hypothetical protein IMY05_010G0087600 [Salix suchowensis]
MYLLLLYSAKSNFVSSLFLVVSSASTIQINLRREKRVRIGEEGDGGKESARGGTGFAEALKLVTGTRDDKLGRRRFRKSGGMPLMPSATAREEGGGLLCLLKGRSFFNRFLFQGGSGGEQQQLDFGLGVPEH